jgi:hypothetical protein
VAAPLGPMAVAGLAAGAEYINLINDLGGNNGVELIGAVGTTGFICTPRFHGALQQSATLAKLGISGRTIMDVVVRAASVSPPLAKALQIPVVATVAAEVAKGTPLGWALAIGVRVIEKIFEGAEPDINDHGAVHANRDQALDWESFLLGRVDDDHVALLSWQGLLSAQMGGGHGVYANRVEVGEWETWRLIDNRDGTVSLQTFNGHWLCAEEGGGRGCQANRTTVGEWERFVLEDLPGGKVALRTKHSASTSACNRTAEPDINSATHVRWAYTQAHRRVRFSHPQTCSGGRRGVHQVPLGPPSAQA